jgi:hypothetical protein
MDIRQYQRQDQNKTKRQNQRQDQRQDTRKDKDKTCSSGSATIPHMGQTRQSKIEIKTSQRPSQDKTETQIPRPVPVESVAHPLCNVTLATIIARAILAIFPNNIVFMACARGVRVLRMTNKKAR